MVASVDSNLRGFKRSVQHEKYSFICLFCPSKISKPLVKWKTQFMLGNYELDKVHLKKKAVHYVHEPSVCIELYKGMI